MILFHAAIRLFVYLRSSLSLCFDRYRFDSSGDSKKGDETGRSRHEPRIVSRLVAGLDPFSMAGNVRVMEIVIRPPTTNI